MRIISVNVNGIRAAARKGLFGWLSKEAADVVCLQETRSQEHQLDNAVFCPDGYHCHYFDAERPGYSGTALFSRVKPRRIVTGMGWAIADTEGRYIQADFDGVSVASIYIPSGSSSPAAQQRKFEFLDHMKPWLEGLLHQRQEFILCGDWNIAHKQIDLKNWRSNQKNSGFLPEERAWMDWLLGKAGFVDAFRVVNNTPDQYTWWSNRGQAWAKNVGWRIDYQIVTPGMGNKVIGESIYKQERFSDHAPLVIEYDHSLS